MFPFKKILCPTDFSEPSLCGIKMAKELCAGHDTEIILLNVHKPIPHLPTPRLKAAETTFDVSSYEEAIMEEAREQLRELRDRIIGDEIKTEVHVHMGAPDHEILAVAKEFEVDAICIATHGHTGIKKIVFGSVAQRVVRRAHCPVLTIRACE